MARLLWFCIFKKLLCMSTFDFKNTASKNHIKSRFDFWLKQTVILKNWLSDKHGKNFLNQSDWNLVSQFKKLYAIYYHLVSTQLLQVPPGSKNQPTKKSLFSISSSTGGKSTINQCTWAVSKPPPALTPRWCEDYF